MRELRVKFKRQILLGLITYAATLKMLVPRFCSRFAPLDTLLIALFSTTYPAFFRALSGLNGPEVTPRYIYLQRTNIIFCIIMNNE